jgi:serine/threonine protein kinase
MRLTIATTLSGRCFAQGILKGLLELEREEVVHRDIKLENIMVRDANSL